MKHRIIRKVATVDSGDITIIGIDPSLNGTAVAVIQNGEVKSVLGWTEKITVQKDNPELLSWFKLPPRSGFSERQHRLNIIFEWVLSIIEEACILRMFGVQVFVAIEGYAISKRSNRSTDIHELCGLIKRGVWELNVPLRIYDPKTLKMAWVHGNADKTEMMVACKEHFNRDYLYLGEDPGSNLADALLAAQLLWVEVQLKAGLVLLYDQTSNMKRVMTRKTEPSPVPLTDRPFIIRENLEPLRNRKKNALRPPIYGASSD